MQRVGSRRAAAVLMMGLWSATGHAEAGDAEKHAQRIYQRLTGVPLDDARLQQMTQLVEQGKLAEAARIATEDPKFYNLTLWNLTAGLSNVDQSPYVDFNDFMASIVGVAKDDVDARTLLFGDFHYEGRSSMGLPASALGDNEHFKQLGVSSLNLKSDLVRVGGQLLTSPDTAGVLTSRQWAKEHFNAGTNRRALEHTFQEFLCAPIQSWKDVGLTEYHIRRDVDRAPGGDPANFQNVCRTCHAGMDGMTGAFARYDFKDGQPVYYGTNNVAPKMNQNGHVYPEGYVTFDDSWVNLATQHHNVAFGWRGALEGNGVRQFGTMVSNAKAYSSCWTKRAFQEICKRAPGTADDATVQTIATTFETGGYKLRSLFENVAASEACLGTVGSEIPLALKNFRQLFESYAVITRIPTTDAVVRQAFDDVKTRLPRQGQVSEVSSPMLLAATTLSGAFCKQMIQGDSVLASGQRRAHRGIDFSNASLAFNRAARMNQIQDYARLFWNRSASDSELDSLLEVIGYESEQRLLSLDERKKVLLMSCTATASSMGSLLF